MIGSASCSPAGPGLSAYTLIVETKTQRASRVAATALRTCEGWRATSTTASQPPSATASGTSSVRSHGRWVAPSGTGPD